MSHHRSLFAVFLALLAPLASCADEPAASVVLPGESRPTAARLDEARRHLRDRRGDGLSLLQAVLDASANDLVSLPDGRLVAARWLGQAILSRSDRRDLARYRKRSDLQARRWLDTARRAGITGPLHRVVEEAFCSRQAIPALDQLGDLAFERGRFDEAESWWRLLAPLEPIARRDADADQLAYPDPPGDLVARVRAKQLLARLYRRQPGFQANLDAYRTLHPKASGTLAGKTGLYADTLAAVAAEQARADVVEGDWPTFGGSPARGRVAPAPPRLLDRLSQLCRAGPTWQFDLARRSRQAVEFMAVPKGGEIEAARRLAFHPVVVGHRALVADARYVTAFDLRTGKAEEWYDAGQTVGGIDPRLGLPAVRDLRYTLTVAEGCVFARMGTQSIRDIRPEPGKPARPLMGDAGESVLVCLGLEAGSDGDRRRWQVRAIDPGRKEHAIFEGAPLVHDGRVYIAATRFEGDRVATAIHCYAAHPEDNVSPLLWRTEVCETRELLPAGTGDDAGRKQRHRQHLLTLAGSRLVWCSHSGAIVALDARTGRRAWARRYPRRDVREPDDEPVLRDLAPPLYADGRLFVAPSDSDRLYCLDAMTGATTWERDRLDVVHLVGVGSGRLIFTTWRNPQLGRLHAGGLRAVLAEDGSDTGGWALPDDGGGLVPFGRPLLVGDLVLWPTFRSPYGVFAVRQTDGQQTDNPTLLYRIPSGNLVFANGCLLVADRQTLWAFVPPELLPDEEEKTTRAPSPREELTRLIREAQRPGSDGWNDILSSSRWRQEIIDDARGLPQRAGWVAASQRRSDEVALRRLWEATPSPSRLGLGIDLLTFHPTATTTRQALAELARPIKQVAPSPGETLLPVDLVSEAILDVGESFLRTPSTEGSVGERSWSIGRAGLVGRSRETGEVFKVVALPFSPSWARGVGNLLVAAGPAGAALVDPITGTRLWNVAAPGRGRYPATREPLIRAIADPRRPEPFTGFHLAGERLFLVQGERRLLCLDALTGATLWERWAPGACFDMPWPRGRFLVVCPVSGDRLLVQASARRWLLDTASGAVIASAPSRLERWPRSPLLLGDGTLCLVPDPDGVERLDVRTGKRLWRYTIPGNTIRSGEPPLLVATEDALVVVEPLNFGHRIQKLDRALGKPLWSRPPLVNLRHTSPSAWLAAGEMLHHAGEGNLSAWSLADGRPLWRRPLEGGPAAWKLARWGGMLLAWAERGSCVRFRFRWLTGSLQWRVGPLPDDDAWSVRCFDRVTGDLVQRLNLEPETSTLRQVPVWEPGGSTWPTFRLEREQARTGPTVVLDRLGLVVAVGNRVKTFRMAGTSSSK